MNHSRPSIDLLERRLLAAARLESPRAAARQRTIVAIASGATIGSAAASAAALGAAAGSTGTGSASGATATALAGSKVVVASATFVGVAKAVTIGAISGAVVLGASQQIQHAYAPRQPASHVAIAERRAETIRVDRATIDDRAIDNRASDPPPAPSPETEPPAVEKPIVQKPAFEAARPSFPRSDTLADPPLRSPSSARSLAEEVAVLDRARDALLHGDAARALRILDEYERSPTATLSSEAAVLRIEALLGTGQRERAASLAAAFLRDHPESPVADRMRAIIHGTTK